MDGDGWPETVGGLRRKLTQDGGRVSCKYWLYFFVGTFRSTI